MKSETKSVMVIIHVSYTYQY